MVGGRQAGVRGHCVTPGSFQARGHQQRSSLPGSRDPAAPLLPAWEPSQPSPGTHGCPCEQLLARSKQD